MNCTHLTGLSMLAVGLLFALATCPSVSVAFRIDDDGSLHDDDSSALSTEIRSKRGGIDMCLCCSQKQLSFCCNACMQSRSSIPSAKLLADVDPLALSLSERMLARRMNNLRYSACNCCQKSPAPNSRCCQLCRDLEN